MTTHRLSWRGPRTALEALDLQLTEVIDPPADATSLMKDDPVEDDTQTGWTLHAYFSEAPSLSLMEALSDLGDAPEVETLEDRDWVAHSLEGLGVVRAGAFVLFGRHDADKAARMDGLPLQVEANRAFGTGHHPTTAGCLEAITFLRSTEPGHVLDLGTGSGILAMASRRLWPNARILGTDMDRISVAHARENAEVNGIDDLHFEVAEGLTESMMADEPFDLVLANILAEPLMELAASICGIASPTGHIVLAGLLDRQESPVVATYAANGWHPARRLGTTPWPVLILARP